MTDPSLPGNLDPLWQGIAEFNQGEFYACHDTLEAIWMISTTPEKPFFQGILQLAVALYHLGNHNWRGAVILLGEGMRRLEPFEPSYLDVNVSDLLDRTSPWLETLQQSGPEQVEAIASALTRIRQDDRDVDAITTLPRLEIYRAS